MSNSKSSSVKNNKQIDDLLMKPFSLGWTREVVKRNVCHLKSPVFDIYYFSPTKKKLRSLTEVKNHLTDGLSLDCFSFKREPLGLDPDLELVRNARSKTADKFQEKEVATKQPEKVEEKNISEKEIKHEKEEEMNDTEKETLNSEKEADDKKKKMRIVEPEVLMNNESPKKERGNEKIVQETENKGTETKSKRMVNKTNSYSNKKKKKVKPTKSKEPVRLQSAKKRKSVLKMVINAKKAKQTNLRSSKKIIKKIVTKAAASKKVKTKSTKKKAEVKTNKNNSVKIKQEKKIVRNCLTIKESEKPKEPESDNIKNKSTVRDLKSIVQKNIGKYREMREKQKLGGGKLQRRNSSRKLTAIVSSHRSQPISQNMSLFLKPLQKGWRRELVFRTVCSRGSQSADVYYFHPNGKKLRSFREIEQNLTQGLHIECFTFKREPIGCGEPSEVVRNARSNPKN